MCAQRVLREAGQSLRTRGPTTARASTHLGKLARPRWLAPAGGLLAGLVEPILSLEPMHLLEVLRVIGDESQVQGHGMRCDEGVEYPDGRALGPKSSADAAKHRGSCSVEGHHLDGRNEGINELVKALGPSFVSAEAQFRQRHRAETDF